MKRTTTRLSSKNCWRAAASRPRERGREQHARAANAAPPFAVDSCTHPPRNRYEFSVLSSHVCLGGTREIRIGASAWAIFVNQKDRDSHRGITSTTPLDSGRMALAADRNLPPRPSRYNPLSAKLLHAYRSHLSPRRP